MLGFTVQGSTAAIERFDEWVATHNSQHKKTVVLGGRQYVLGDDGPYVFIGVAMHGGQPRYEFIGPSELVPALVNEIAANFPYLTLTQEGAVVVQTAEKPKTKKPERRVAPQEDAESTYRFLNHYEFVWHGTVQLDGKFKGYEWQIKDQGSHWLMKVLLNPSYRFTHALYEEVGLFPGWITLQHAEQMIFKAIGYPVVDFNPSPMFLRKWLDHWIEINACSIWNHVYDTLRKTKPIREAEKRANELKAQFESLYLEPIKKPQAAVKPQPQVEPPPIVEVPTPPIVKTQLHSGLKRDLKRDRVLRDMLDRLEGDGNVSDKALRQLLQFWGIQVRATEIVGDRTAYFYATSQYRRLLEIAGERGWTQSIINMYGVMAEGAFERIA